MSNLTYATYYRSVQFKTVTSAEISISSYTKNQSSLDGVNRSYNAVLFMVEALFSLPLSARFGLDNLPRRSLLRLLYYSRHLLHPHR